MYIDTLLKVMYIHCIYSIYIDNIVLKFNSLKFRKLNLIKIYLSTLITTYEDQIITN